jgi:hypothetical protein
MRWWRWRQRSGNGNGEGGNCKKPYLDNESTIRHLSRPKTAWVEFDRMELQLVDSALCLDRTAGIELPSEPFVRFAGHRPFTDVLAFRVTYRALAHTLLLAQHFAKAPHLGSSKPSPDARA